MLGTSWNTEIKVSGTVLLRSRFFRAPDRGIFLARECVLDVPEKFFAETLLVYPNRQDIFPIFGSEYIKTLSRSFGATDFHPTTPNTSEIPTEFDLFQERIVEKSPHYDLNNHFSNRLWHKKSKNDFYEEFADICESRLRYYLEVLAESRSSDPPDPQIFSDFDTYMAVNDPAHGILRAHFGADFSNDYIRGFLFPHCRYSS